jgi:release factor glutamine methyltransferase
LPRRSGLLDQRMTAAGGSGSIYPVREDTELLAPFAAARRGERVLEIGTGNGALALRAARAGASVVATDLNRAALQALAGTARAERLPLLAVRTDVADGTRRFDRILANPPYLPTPAGGIDPDEGDDLALNGGPDGCALTARYLRAFRRHLARAGAAYLLVSSLQDRTRLERLRDEWRRRTGDVQTVADRNLSGERIEVWKLTLRARGPAPSRPAAERAPRSPTGTADRPTGPRVLRFVSSPAPAPGRTHVPGAASDRRRSPRGS